MVVDFLNVTNLNPLIHSIKGLEFEEIFASFCLRTGKQRQVPALTISVYGSSCNYFLFHFILVLFIGIPKAAWDAKKSKEKANERE